MDKKKLDAFLDDISSDESDTDTSIKKVVACMKDPNEKRMFLGTSLNGNNDSDDDDDDDDENFIVNADGKKTTQPSPYPAFSTNLDDFYNSECDDENDTPFRGAPMLENDDTGKSEIASSGEDQNLNLNQPSNAAMIAIQEALEAATSPDKKKEKKKEKKKKKKKDKKKKDKKQRKQSE